MQQVDFFLVGWPKTGSTSLHYYLSQHPEIFMATVKESYFFCTDIINDSNQHGTGHFFHYQDEARYETLFKGWKEHQLIGESSVFYSISEDAIFNIHKRNPKAQIILILREPIELLDSWFNYLKLHSRETADSLEAALELQEQRAIGNQCPVNTQARIHLQYDQIVDFPRHLDRIFKCFAKDQVKIILYDDYKANREKTVMDVYSFLNVNPEFVPDYTEKNVSQKAKHKIFKHLVDRNKHLVKKILKPVGLLHENGLIHRMYLKIFTANERRKQVSDQRKKLLKQRYLEKVEEASRLLDIDLVQKWNY